MRHGVRVVILAGMTAVAMACGNALAQNAVLRSGAGQSVHALIIEIDAYQNVRPLKGAAADARDIEVALRSMGVTDIVPLIDEQANRDNLLKSIDQILQRIKPGDLVVFSLAGHGAQEPERVKGSQPDGKDDIFLLAGFGLTGAASQQRIIGREFNYFIKQFESRGAAVLFVADTCHGGGLTREVDPRGGELSYRQVPQYTLVVDELRPVGAPADALLTQTDFERTAFLAAVDRATKAPEVRIPGVEGYRGALSYAVARAIEGKADADHDGKTTLQELFTDVRGLVYQLSNQRQNAVAVASLSQKPELRCGVPNLFTNEPTGRDHVAAAHQRCGGSCRTRGKSSRQSGGYECISSSAGGARATRDAHSGRYFCYRCRSYLGCKIERRHFSWRCHSLRNRQE